jgi:acyl carrier protein
MVPAHFVLLTQLPLTINGKIDRLALPKPEVQASVPFQAPRDETESVLAEIWKSVLGIDVAGIHDDFFELGGHSLKAFLAISAIGKEMDTAISLRDIFRNPTIERLAEEIKRKKWLRSQVAVGEQDSSLNVIDL